MYNKHPFPAMKLWWSGTTTEQEVAPMVAVYKMNRIRKRERERERERGLWGSGVRSDVSANKGLDIDTILQLLGGEMAPPSTPLSVKLGLCLSLRTILYIFFPQ